MFDGIARARVDSKSEKSFGSKDIKPTSKVVDPIDANLYGELWWHRGITSMQNKKQRSGVEFSNFQIGLAVPLVELL